MLFLQWSLFPAPPPTAVGCGSSGDGLVSTTRADGKAGQPTTVCIAPLPCMHRPRPGRVPTSRDLQKWVRVDAEAAVNLSEQSRLDAQRARDEIQIWWRAFLTVK